MYIYSLIKIVTDFTVAIEPIVRLKSLPTMWYISVEHHPRQALNMFDNWQWVIIKKGERIQYYNAINVYTILCT